MRGARGRSRGPPDGPRERVAAESAAGAGRASGGRLVRRAQARRRRVQGPPTQTGTQTGSPLPLQVQEPTQAQPLAQPPWRTGSPQQPLQVQGPTQAPPLARAPKQWQTGSLPPPALVQVPTQALPQAQPLWRMGWRRLAQGQACQQTETRRGSPPPPQEPPLVLVQAPTRMRTGWLQPLQGLQLVLALVLACCLTAMRTGWPLPVQGRQPRRGLGQRSATQTGWQHRPRFLRWSQRGWLRPQLVPALVLACWRAPRTGWQRQRRTHRQGWQTGLPCVTTRHV